MDLESEDSSSSRLPSKTEDNKAPALGVSEKDSSEHQSTIRQTASGISFWARNLKLPLPLAALQDSSKTESGASTFSRFTNGIGLHFPPTSPVKSEGTSEFTSASAQPGVLKSLGKGLVNSSRTAVKAVQVKARHIVSQNKRRYQEGGFDLDLTYITENVIAMGFPGGDMSSGLFGYVEGFYRNHVEEVVRFLETFHKGKYKVYNLCSERLYDASLFKGEVASFPFDDHNCPPLQLIASFCHSAHSWLKEDLKNVVVVHCKAGTARTGLLISSLLLFLKFCPTEEEAVDYYNHKRCLDGKALILPSQIRYVKYFEQIIRSFNGEVPPGRRCMLRGLRLHKCPYWIRPYITISDHSGTLFSTKSHRKTKDLLPQDFWVSTSRKRSVVFALPGQSYVTELSGDFKVHFVDLHGEFYCWLNTSMIENRIFLGSSDLDGFDRRNLPSPGFQLEIVLLDPGSSVLRSKLDPTNERSHEKSRKSNAPDKGVTAQGEVSRNQDNDDIFSDSEGEAKTPEMNRNPPSDPDSGYVVEHSLTKAQQVPPNNDDPIKREFCNNDRIVEAERSVSGPKSPGEDSASKFKAIAADASVFSFGDEEDFESE